MGGRGDDKAERVIRRVLAQGPADVLEILAALREAAPALIARREGLVHALLLRAVRKGRVAASAPAGASLARYRLPTEPAPDPAGGTAEAGAAEAERAARIAKAVSDGAARERVARDVAAHLADLAGRGDTAAFGADRGARQMLHRVARGRAAVCLADGAGDVALRGLLQEGPWIVGAIVVFFVLKLFVVQVYRIPSRSMEPNLQVGDRVAVWLPGAGGVPERWSVLTYELEGVTYVKRLVGLPGEEIALLHGDVFIDGKMLVKPDAVREALRSRVDAWSFADGVPQGWHAGEDATGVRHLTWSSGGFPAHPPGSLGNSYVLRDGYAVVDASWSGEGKGVSVTLARGPEGAGPDERLVWSLHAGKAGILLIRRRGDSDATSQIVKLRARPPAAGDVRLELSYVDGELRAACDGWSWSGAEPAPDGPLGLSVAQHGAGNAVLRVRLDRDLHYAHLGALGVPVPGAGGLNPHRIPPRRIFCMGDNTTDSKDSRYRVPGTIPADAIIGPVRIRIWPPGRVGRVP